MHELAVRPQGDTLLGHFFGVVGLRVEEDERVLHTVPYFELAPATGTDIVRYVLLDETLF
jgi:hypothetical protein